MTDKYWAATIIPDQSRAFTGQFGSDARRAPRLSRRRQP